MRSCRRRRPCRRYGGVAGSTIESVGYRLDIVGPEITSRASIDVSPSKLDDGRKVTADLVRSLIPEELAKVKADVGPNSPTYDRAAQIFEKMSTQEAFAEFLTLPLYEEIA